MIKLNNLELKIKKLLMNTCKRNLKMEEKLLYTNKSQNFNKRKLKIYKDKLMI